MHKYSWGVHALNILEIADFISIWVSFAWNFMPLRIFLLSITLCRLKIMFIMFILNVYCNSLIIHQGYYCVCKGCRMQWLNNVLLSRVMSVLLNYVLIQLVHPRMAITKGAITNWRKIVCYIATYVATCCCVLISTLSLAS